MNALEEIRSMPDVLITPDVAARVLGCNPQNIRLQAEKNPSLLGFPVCRIGNQTKIPRVPFLKWLTGE